MKLTCKSAEISPPNVGGPRPQSEARGEQQQMLLDISQLSTCHRGLGGLAVFHASFIQEGFLLAELNFNGRCALL